MEPRTLDNAGKILAQGLEEKLGIHVMDIASDSTINKGPAGWTVTDSGTGDYTINHTLGHDDFIVLAQSYGTATQVVQVSAKDNNSFDINIDDAGDGSTAEDGGLHILVIVQGGADPVA